MRRSSRESITLERESGHFDIELYYDRTKGSYVYYLPKVISESDRVYLIQKLKKYGEKKHYEILKGE